MDFEYKGGNCVVISSKQAVVVIDGKLSTLGLKDVVPPNAIELATQDEFAVKGEHVTIDMPGEYEVYDVSIRGIAAKRMIDSDSSMQATIYRLVFPEVTIGVIGHITFEISDEQLEELGMIDVLIIPTGGGGYTLDSHQAVEIVNKINPKVVIPTHYADKDVRYEVPQEPLEPFIKELGGTHEVLAKWKLKSGILPELQTIIELTRTS